MSNGYSSAPSGVEEKMEPMPPPALVSYRRKTFIWGLVYVSFALVVGVILGIPIILFRSSQDLSESDDLTLEQRQYKNLMYYLFSWLLITWMSLVASDWIALGVPYLFRFITRYVNPAHQKYWRVFRMLRRPIVFLGVTAASYGSFTTLINTNELLAVNYNKDPNNFGNWDDVIDDVLQQVSLWVCFYFVQKVLIMYITIHYHYRSDLNKIAHSKDMHNALISLYEASLYLHPANSGAFDTEDMIIRNAAGFGRDSTRVRATSYLSRLGVDTYKMTSFFGNFMGDEGKSHWLQPATSYATIERALANPKAAAALAKRIWTSLAVYGSETLTAKDVVEVFGPFRKDEAVQIFKILDENEGGDIRLDEFVMTLVEAGRVRHDIYQNMQDIDHCINTFDWVLLFIMAAVMIAFILVAYVPTLKEIQQTLSYVAIGLSFAVGRIFHHFLSGCTLVLFAHPYDIGDRVEIWNMASSIPSSLVVKRQSLLYTIFRRLDNGTDVQIANERLLLTRIENITRSGNNRQALSIYVDFRTEFQDIVYLRKELEEFLTSTENRRDYTPDLALSIVNLHELNKIELRVSFGHKSNWGNEKLRAARSNKFYCALLAAIRRVPIFKPGGPLAVGEEGRPMYTVHLDNQAGTEKMQTALATRAANRINAPKAVENEEDVDPEKQRKKAELVAKAAAVKEAEKAAQMTLSKMPPPEKKDSALAVSTAVEVSEFVGTSSTGLRMKSNSGAEVMFHR